MILRRFLLIPSAAVLLLGLYIAPLAAQNPATAQLAQQQRQIETQRARIQELSEEYDTTVQRRREAEASLGAFQKELQERQAQVEAQRAALPANASDEEREAINNEAQRVALAELTVRSRVAGIVRMERKEQELQEEMSTSRTAIRTAERRINEIRARLEEENQAQARAMAEQLEALQQENEQLRLAMEEQARQTAAAEEEAARLAVLAEAQALSDDLDTAYEAAPGATADGAPSVVAPATPVAPERPPAPLSRRATGGQDLSQMVLEGEPPIFQERDFTRVIVRSRSIEQNLTMEAIAPNIYRGEVQVQPGRAYFDIRNRRYRGFFPDRGAPVTYEFYYDMTPEDRPVFSVREKPQSAQ